MTANRQYIIHTLFMKEKYYLNICLLLLTFIGCNNVGTTTDSTQDDAIVYRINIQDALSANAVIQLSEIADSIRYVELKTPYSMPIGVVSNIKISDEYIFVIYKGVAYQFNHKGEFLRKIGAIGQGAGEYASATDIFIDDNECQVNILSNTKLYTYSFDGKFVRQRRIGFLSDMILQDSLIYASITPFGLERYRMVVLNTELDTLGGIPNDNIFDTGGLTMSVSLRFRQPFYKYKNEVYFKGYQQNDTIWRINGIEYETHAIIDMGKYKPPECKNVNDMHSSFDRFVKKEGDYYFVLSVMEDSHYMYMSLDPCWNPEMGSPRLLFDKHQQSGFAPKTESGAYGITDDILGGPAFWPQIISGKYYVSVTDAYKMIENCQSLSSPSPQFQEFIHGINEDSNPIVTIVTLKGEIVR